MRKLSSSNRSNWLKKLTSSREFSLLLIIIVLCAVIQLRNSNFLTANVINSILKNYSYTMTLSVGMLMVLLIGGIDISIGSTLAISGMCASLLMRAGVLPNAFCVFAVSTIVGAFCGWIIGLVISKGKVIPIIATLGFQYIWRGMSYLISDFKSVNASSMLQGYKQFAQSSTLGINNLVLITLAVYVIFFIVLRWTKFGRRIYAIGSNPEAAVVSGIRIDRIKIAVYTMMGAICGLCGSMYVSYYASSQNNMATGIEMDVIASCVVGGVSLSGGRGSVVGVLLGSLTIAIISKSLSLVGINPFWQQALKGAIILVAVVINATAQRNMEKRALAKREV